MLFHCIKMSQYFPKPYEAFGRDINVKNKVSDENKLSDVVKKMLLKKLYMIN